MSVTLADLCNLDLNQVTSLSTECLQDDPACPRDAFLRSPGIYDPQDEAFTRLADGDYNAADFKSFDIGGLFGTASAGNGCSTNCSSLETFEQRAFQIRWNDCLSEDAMVNFCRGVNPVASPLDVMIDLSNTKRTVENTCYILAALGGIYATAAADQSSNIVCDFTTESPDGTADITLENLARSVPSLACQPDYWVADHYTIQQLRGLGFTPYCCGDNGQVFNSVAPLQDPNGIPIVEMADEYAEYFDPANDGSTLMIGIKNNSIGWRRTTENDTSERQTGFVQNAFNTKTNPCDPTVFYMNERAALHVGGYSFSAPIVQCTDQNTKALLMTAGTNVYAPTPNARRGWDKSAVVFLKGNIPTVKRPVV